MNLVKEQVKILRRKDVEAITGLSRSTIYNKMEDGSFPTQIQLTERSVGWIEAEVQEWLKNRVLASREGGCYAIPQK